MSSNQGSNRTIAKNTLYLYFRMFVMLVAGLYTSRIVLRELGIVDYGINNVVSSLLTLFTFIQGSLSSAASRYLAFEIGKGNDGNLNKLFCITMNIHLLFAILILVLCETIGLWYFYYKLVLPPNRFFAALVVYQMSVFGAILSLLVVPYNAMIIAQEHMKAFAYLSIINVLFKLLTALALCVTPIDKLITISLLGVCFNVVVNFLYFMYCSMHFKECKYRKMWDHSLFKEMLVYSGWSVASYSSVVVTQFSNLMINAFFGPVVNAARAVSNAVQQYVVSFVYNFQVALNPQIIKNYAANNSDRVFELVNMSQKISFSLLYILFFPLLTNINYILNLWLVEVPQFTDSLIIIVAISSMFLAIINPLGVIVEAANRLKMANLITIPYYCISVIVVYVALRCGCNVIQMFSIFAIFDIVSFLVALMITRAICKIPLKVQLLFYLRTLFSVLIGLVLGSLISDMGLYSFFGFFIKLAISVVVAVIIVSSLIVSSSERVMVYKFVSRKLFFNL